MRNAGIALIFLGAFAASSRAQDLGQRLFDGFLRETKPKEAIMILDEEPSETGKVRRIYLDLKGATIGGVVIDRITVEAFDTVFSSPNTWDTDQAKVLSVLATNARAVIKESDINSHLRTKEFGKDERWRGLVLDFCPGRVYAKGRYLADLKIFKLNILIELDGTFKVRNGKEIWLEDYKLKLNRAKVPEGLTDRAMKKIQPILDMGKFVFPVRLSKVALDEEKAVIESVRPPKPFDGLIYEYKGPLGEEERPK